MYFCRKIEIMSIGYYTRRKYNFFSYLPQEKSSGAFFMWLIHYLNSEDDFASYRQMFSSSILLFGEDKGREVKDVVPVYEQDDHVIVVSFKFMNEDELRKTVIVLAENTWDIATPKALDRVRRLYPESYNYIYFRMAYVSTMEERLLTKEKWSLMSSGLFTEVLDSLLKLKHPLIKMYSDELTYKYHDEYDEMQDKMYIDHNRELLVRPEAARNVYDNFIENLFEDDEKD